MLDYEDGIDVLLCAKNQREEEMLFERWIHLLSDISFESFKSQIGYRPHKIDTSQSAEDILQSVKRIMGG